MKKNLIRIILANLAYMILVAGTNFLLPKFTSYETYAAVKEYTLYITTYAELLTFGYVQGMYLKYGGKNIEELSPVDFGRNFCSYIVFQTPIAIIITIIGLHIKKPLIAVLGLGIIVSNLLKYYQMLYQATGEFKAYGIALNANRVLLLLGYVLWIFVVKTDNYLFYVLSSPGFAIPILLILAFYLNRKVPYMKHATVSGEEMKSSVSLGFILMLGVFVSSFFSSISKWFVNIFMDDVQFSHFSFAVSMENLVTTFMSPITVSMYNLFCKHPPLTEIKKIKDATLVWAFVVVAGAFPINMIIQWVMPNYLPSIQVMVPLFAAQALLTLVNGIYVNKYKAEGKQKKYLIMMVSMVAVAFVANTLAYLLFGTILAFAVATLAVMFIWFIVCEITEKEWRYGVRSYAALAIMLVSYLLTGFMPNVYIGCAIYVCVGIITALVLMRPTVKQLLSGLIRSKKEEAGVKLVSEK